MVIFIPCLQKNMPNKKNMEYCSNGKHANFVLPTKTPNKGIFTYLYGKNVENKESKITPPRPSENLDFLLFITVLMAYKAL